MKCPYCVSNLDSKALVCHSCKRDIALPRQLMLKISQLEKTLQTLQSQQIKNPESERPDAALAPPRASLSFSEKCRGTFLDLAKFFVLPLLLLLLAHICITIVYDTKILYLRIVTLLLPMCFGYLLCRDRSRNIFAWAVGVIILGWIAVVGMSTVTSVVDGSPIWPQSMYVWRDMIEFAASISFSYLTGMFLGRLTLMKSKSASSSSPSGQQTDAWLADRDDERLPSASIQYVAKKVSEFTTTIGAIITTIIAIYTGLKGLF